jgi:hypothetical protein
MSPAGVTNNYLLKLWTPGTRISAVVNDNFLIMIPEIIILSFLKVGSIDPWGVQLQASRKGRPATTNKTINRKFVFLL